MMRAEHWNVIEGRLSWLSARVVNRAALNVLDFNVLAEDFYRDLLNLIYGWRLINLPTNTQAVDLVDAAAKIVVQVSSTASKQKIEASLAKILPAHRDHSFKFVCIGQPNHDLRKQTFLNPHQLTFVPANDIFDCPSLLTHIRTMDLAQMGKIRDFLCQQIPLAPDIAKVESNLTSIIKLIGREDWNPRPQPIEVVPYDIEGKITANSLDKACYLIEDHRVHHHRLAKIYAQFDQQGANKSRSVLDGIRAEFLALSPTLSSDQLFFETIANVITRIMRSANFTPIPQEELQMCVELLVVDAFIQCKIFKNPGTVAHVDS
ncbi:MAG: SMEK domain-containing protein [Verrucomicrobia bacterium]|nr:SMEK domain-containing protein [Verrucomicrobiota bacterium]